MIPPGFEPGTSGFPKGISYYSNEQTSYKTSALNQAELRAPITTHILHHLLPQVNTTGRKAVLAGGSTIHNGYRAGRMDTGGAGGSAVRDRRKDNAACTD